MAPVNHSPARNKKTTTPLIKQLLLSAIHSCKLALCLYFQVSFSISSTICDALICRPNWPLHVWHTNYIVHRLFAYSLVIWNQSFVISKPQCVDAAPPSPSATPPTYMYYIKPFFTFIIIVYWNKVHSREGRTFCCTTDRALDYKFLSSSYSIMHVGCDVMQCRRIAVTSSNAGADARFCMRLLISNSMILSIMVRYIYIIPSMPFWLL